jgi:hypothetical protein
MLNLPHPIGSVLFKILTRTVYKLSKKLANEQNLRCFVLFCFSVLFFGFVCISVYNYIQNAILNSSYIVKQKDDFIGTWKVRGVRSYLILHLDGTFEFIYPTELSINCLPNDAIIFHPAGCYPIAKGRWTHKTTAISRSDGNKPCSCIILGGTYSFYALGKNSRLRLISYQPPADGYVLILDKITSSYFRCPICRRSFLPHDVNETKPFEYLNKLDANRYKENISFSRYFLTILIGILLLIIGFYLKYRKVKWYE